MHKRIETDLISLAHSILKMKNKEDVFILKEKAQEVYEKLSVLAHVEEYLNTTPNATETKEELISKVEKSFELKETVSENLEENKEEFQIEETANDVVDAIVESVVNKKENSIEQPFEDLEKLFEQEDDTIKNDVKDVGEKKTLTLEEELKDTISVDAVSDLFEKTTPKSLNDKLQNSIQIGLNDRIIFVKNLFSGNQKDYNRVVSQLNTFKTEKEAKKFVLKMVKPDYNWSEQEELETRFMEIIERRFA